MRGSTAGIGDGLQGISSKYFNFLTFLDQFISTIIVTPLVVGYWRGTWGCMDYFVFNNDIHRSALLSVIIGSIGSFIFTTAQNYFINKYHSNINSLKYYLATRLYTACFGIVCVNQFRGTWICLDLYTPHTITAVSTITLISIIILIITKTLRNLSAPPFALSVDRYEDYFTVPTFFKYVSKSLIFIFETAH
ncbi:hypothetical protein O3M35_007751 [Rhynocoris fuscipes]|uniref:Uncharacterized protein n=1 Tax=Rhynocoris fuscipes TaxID=488301 RepID=A0AAW1DBW2_9HEMI